MTKMEENDEGLNELFSGMAPDQCNMFSGEEGNLGVGDHVNNVENSMFDVGNSSALDVYGGSDELGCLSKSMGSIAERRARKCGFDQCNMFSGEEGNLGVDDHVNNVENSMFYVGNSSALDVYGGSDELGCLSKSRGSIAERRARKCGFDAGKISTPRFRTNNGLPSPCSRSPFLTIPAGISPHMLLDSPILLPNSQLSPTTGTFAASPFDRDGQVMIRSADAGCDYTCDGGLFSMFKDHGDTTSLTSFSDVGNQQLVDFEFPVGLSKGVGMDDCGSSLLPERKYTDDLNLNSNSSTLEPSGTNGLVCVRMPIKSETSTGDDSETYNSSEGQKESYPPVGSARTTEDGFNWRKYGQKQVKGGEYPRSYYKCTHPHCQVKKKVECSQDGQITKIIYKNSHNHPKPHPCRKPPFSALPFKETSDAGNSSSCFTKAEGGSVWRNSEMDVKTGLEWQIDGVERPSSASVVTELSDRPSITEKTAFGVLESTGTPEFSSTLGNYDDEEEDAATPGNFLPGDDEKEPDLKRRNIETTLGSRALRAPRVVVQIESEVDILDDGYHWRKYGQKVVKGNPNPRSYYKCTSAGCKVRKHVERASHNLKYVITTYEGKHNHEVPAARNSSHANSGSRALPSTAPNTQSSLPSAQNPHHPKPEPHNQDLPPPFDARLGCNNDFIRSNFLGSGPPPFYPMKFPTLSNSSPYSPFGFMGYHPAYTSGLMPSIPELPMSMPLGFTDATANYLNPKRMPSSNQSFYSGQQLKDIDVKPIMPKQEQRGESFYATDMHNFDQSDSASSMYNNMMGNFPS